MAARTNRHRIGAAMLIIDSQVHIWPRPHPDRPPHRYEALIAAMDEAGVDRAVLVPPTFDGDDNGYALEAVARHPNRFAIMGRIALDRPAPELLASWRRQPGMLGVRLTFFPRQRPWLTDGTADWFWPAAEQYGIPIMVHATGCFDIMHRIAERHPGLTVIFDHMGASPREAIDLDKIVADIVPFASLPNVNVKLSALPRFSSQPYPFADLSDPVRKIVDAFGPQRCFWGSDLSALGGVASYRQVVTHFTEALDVLSPGELELVMGKALAKCLGWREAQAAA